MHTLYREFTEQAQIDAQYNASLQCANVAAEMRHYVEASQRAREHLPCKLNLPYGPTLAETLDIFPAVQAHAPVFVFLHGGYWRALSSQDFSCIALGLHKLGITTVVVNYALSAGEHRRDRAPGAGRRGLGAAPHRSPPR